jgi:hypothetical protein
MDKHHLLISGTGRAGTTFLVQLMTELGLDTGFLNSKDGMHPDCNAGMEWPLEEICKHTAPYVVKSPVDNKKISQVLETPGVVIDFMIIPVRDLYAAAESRRANAKRAGNAKTAGGLLLTKNPGQQETVLAVQFYHLVHVLAKHDVPMIWLHFPRLVKEEEYLYGKLKPALPGTDFSAFTRAFQAVSQPELVHDFTPQATTSTSWLRRLSGRILG